MSNYDYNKGYRWFRFKKDAAIDPSLPPLVSYRSDRETKPLLVVSNEEQVNSNASTHVHDRIPSRQNYAASSVHLPLLLCASSPMPSLQTDDRAADLVAWTTRASPRLATPGKAPKVAAKQPAFKGKKAVERGKKVARKDQSARGRGHAVNDKELKDCLFIQNGVERFPGYQDGFLSEQKARDIRNWIDKMPDDSALGSVITGTQKHNPR